MAKAKKKNGSGANLGFEAKLWLTADKMRNNMDAAEYNDETLERIYIGRRFKNDTERLEKLFELYSQMNSRQASTNRPVKRKTKGADA